MVHPENEGLQDLDAREVALMVPVVILCVWIGVKPASFLDKTSASIDQLVERIEDARVAYEASGSESERVSTLEPDPSTSSALPR